MIYCILTLSITLKQRSMPISMNRLRHMEGLLMNDRLKFIVIMVFLMGLSVITPYSLASVDLELGFTSPPDSARPWVFWFWINGNISKEGITKDLEAMKRVGVGGVIWMEVSGPRWAPQGPIEAGSKQWHEAMQWAISEADRLGVGFTLSVDFGYGSGGSHITPDISMQKLVWTQTDISGPKPVTLRLEKPDVNIKSIHAWLRPGQQISPKVTKAIKKNDSYRDVAVFAVPSTSIKKSRLISPKQKKNYINQLNTTPKLHGVKDDPLMAYDGRGWKTHLPPLGKDSRLTPLTSGDVIDISGKMDGNGKLRWNAPKGDWTVIRLGYATNLKMTRPCPTSVLGLECDRMNIRGIDAHFELRLKPILEAAGDKAGRMLQYIHIDSWEALGQNWTKGFADEFKKRRGYDIRPWLPVLTGLTVGNLDVTERFLSDLRRTVGEVTLANYIGRLKELAAPYGVGLSCEPYGRLCVNTLDYASRGDFIIGEFWTERKIEKPFPTFSDYWYNSMKGLASIANTYGKTRVGAEAFTGCRGWVDHPYLIKGMGDEAFCNGVNNYVIHLSAHQAYDNIKPGLTHSRWGQHFNRYQTWWEMSKAWFEYVRRCQYLLQQGRRVVDVACLYHEGAPLNFNDIDFKLPEGFDYDFCTPEIIQRMTVKDDRIHLPTGVSYRYLVLPDSGKLTLPVSIKVEELKKQGAVVYLQSPIVGTPGLEGYPESDRRVKKNAKKWPLLPQGGWSEVFTSDKLTPDFEGENLKWIHRRIEGTDIYFVANTKSQSMKSKCTFRIKGKTAELWDPETGEIFALESAQLTDGRTSAVLQFESSQSWFVIFRDKLTLQRLKSNPFPDFKQLKSISGSWVVTFDPEWGRKDTLKLDKLISWSEHSDPLVKYYSGTGVYRKDFELSRSDIVDKNKLCLDLGKVEVMARVKLNGKDCGIAWKPPYRVDISDAVKLGTNKLQIEVVNTWVNRLIGDEQLPLDAKWKTSETLIEWPEWFKKGSKSSSGRYTFTTNRHYKKNSPIMLAGLVGPVRILSYR